MQPWTLKKLPAYSVGKHTLIVGKILDYRITGGRPLIVFRGRLRTVGTHAN